MLLAVTLASPRSVIDCVVEIEEAWFPLPSLNPRGEK